MSTLQFPANPVVGDTYDWDAYKYVWDGEKWKTVGIGYNPVNDLKDAITELGGELDPTAEWSTVPAHSDAEIGGSMNAQAEALAARTKMLHAEVTEALRRSYADAGYNLVDGSFEEGGTLTVASDVLLHKATAAAYAWSGAFPKVVNAGSTPTPLGSGGWINRSDVTLRSDLGVICKRFATVSQMMAAVNLSVGDVVCTDAYNEQIFTQWKIQASGAGDLSDGTIAIAGGLFAKVLPLMGGAKPMLNPLALGVIRNNTSYGNLIKLNKIYKYCSSNGITVTFPAGYFPGTGVTLVIDNLDICGFGKPGVNLGKTALISEGATVFKGVFAITGDNISLSNLGVDCGSSNGIASDCLVVQGRVGTDITAMIKNVKLKSISAIGVSALTANHCVLLQGIDGLDIDDISTTYNYYGVVIKSRNVSVGSVFGDTHGLSGLYLKSDGPGLSGGTYGNCENVHVDSVIYHAPTDDVTSTACDIHASTSIDVKSVTVDSVMSTGGGFALRVRGSGSIYVDGANIGTVSGKYTYQDVFIGANASSLNISQINSKDPRRGVILGSDPNCKNVSIGLVTGKNRGTKEISNIDIDLKGEICISQINIDSNNATPTAAVASVSTVKLGSVVGCLLDFETTPTLINGYTGKYSAPAIRHDGDGFRIIGSVNTTSATADKMFSLSTKLSQSVEKYFNCPANNGTGYVNAVIKISDTGVSWVNRTSVPAQWIDLSGIFIRY